jgi:hypothetical protein
VHGTQGVRLAQDRQGGSGYPVASASLSWSRSKGGCPGGTPDALTDLDARPLTCYSWVPTGRDTRAFADPPLSAPRADGSIPERRPARGICI